MRIIAALAAGLAMARAQAPNAPVIDPRGVTNLYTRQPAPAPVARGGLLEIGGLNLGPPAGVTASGAPWPVKLGDVEVLVNGTAAPVYSADPARVVAQVPPDAALGLAEVVVRRGTAASRPARFQVVEREPALRLADSADGGTITGTATGLGATDPPIAAGDTGPRDPPARPAVPVAAFVGGVKADVAVTASSRRPGEFDVRITTPESARPGDPVILLAGERNTPPVPWRSLREPEVQFLPLPDGAPELRDLQDSDLNGNFLVGAGARDSGGCYPAVRFDLARRSTAPVADCLTAANRNALSPLVAAGNSDALAALVGPAQDEPPAGISSQALILAAGRDPLKVDLPGPAAALARGPSGTFTAVIPGDPPQAVSLDARSGETRSAAAAAPAGALVGLALNFESVDVDGLTHVLAAAAMGQGRTAAIVGDDAGRPQRARFAVLSASGGAALSKEFPEGWLPLLGAQPPARPNAPQANLVLRQALAVDPVRRTYYALARATDNSRHGFVAFTLDSAAPKVIAFPDGWFAAACTANIRVFALELSRRLALVGSNAAEPEFRNNCAGSGFVAVDLNEQTALAVPLPAQAQIIAASANELNDYIYAPNLDSSRRNQTADTLYVLDGVTASAFRIALPTGINGFSIGGLRPAPPLSALIGAASDRLSGDQGLVIFQFEQAAATLLPVPGGFERVAEEDLLPATRKLAARAFLADNAGSQFVIYDLAAGDAAVVPNPDGVVSVGPLPQAAGPGQPGTPGQPRPGGGGVVAPGGAAAAARLVSVNPKANTLAAVGYNGDGKQAGVVVVRVP